MLEEFKKFALRGNVVDLAVGVISGAAFGEYRLAADQGFALAQNNLGNMYEKGLGVPQNYTEAVSWYRLAASQGSASGQNNLAHMYSSGQGVPQNHSEALK
jgi:TPR repeat protein